MTEHYSTLTIGSDVTIHIQNGGGVGWNPSYPAGSHLVSVINNGTILADTAGGSVYLRADQGWTNNGVIEAVAGASIYIEDAGTNNGTNNGMIRASGGGTLTLFNWVNNGVIEGLSGSSLSLTNWTNNGTITVDGGGTASLGGGWTNNQTLGVSGGSTLNLSGSGTWATTATALTTDASSQVNFFGSITNPGTLALSGAGTYLWQGTSLLGGTATLSNGAVLTVTSAGGVLDGVTLNGDLNLAVGQLTIVNGLTLNGTATVGTSSLDSYGYLYLLGSQTLGGTGQIVLGAHSCNGVRLNDHYCSVTAKKSDWQNDENRGNCMAQGGASCGSYTSFD